MGYNISGIVINKNYRDDINSLEKILGKKIYFKEEVVFEDASENWKEDDYCDVYFTNKGTLIFVSMEEAAFEYFVPHQNALSFVLSEMSMTFSINYTTNEKIRRSLVVLEDESRPIDAGEPFDFEKEESDPSELIYHLIEKTLGKGFWDIDLEETCYRYNF